MSIFKKKPIPEDQGASIVEVSSIRRSKEDEAAMAKVKETKRKQKEEAKAKKAEEKRQKEEAQRLQKEESLRNKLEDEKLKTQLESTKARAARARSSRRQSSFAASATRSLTRGVAGTTTGAIRASGRVVESQTRQPKVYSRPSSRVSLSSSPRSPQSDSLGGLRQLTAPRVPGTSSPIGLSPMGDLSHLRGMMIGNSIKSTPTVRVSPNQSAVLTAVQSGITENKEIANLTRMPIMQVARAKIGLQKKGLIKE